VKGEKALARAPFRLSNLIKPTLFVAIAALCFITMPDEARAKSAPNVFVISARPLQLEAPADVYFGPFKLSNLGVRNAIHDMHVEGNSPLALPGQIERIQAIQDALSDWSLQYPQDPWLPSTMLSFAEFLDSKGIPAYERIAWPLFDELATLYPNTSSGRIAFEHLSNFILLPENNFDVDPGNVGLPWLFESQPTGIGENRHYHLF
jgi:hypothetical protein